MRAAVDGRRARIVLGEEAVDVRFAGDDLIVEPPGTGAPDGTGVTDRATTLELMDGYLEVTDAILDGRLDVTGTVDDVERMFAAVEILLDVAARAPALQDLAADYRADPCREPRRGPSPAPVGHEPRVRARPARPPRPAARPAGLTDPGVAATIESPRAPKGGLRWAST